MKHALTLGCLILLSVSLGADAPYDFRKSKAYADLSEADRTKLDQVDQDLTLLWGALDRFGDDGGKVPRELKELVPLYLKTLPADPFSGKDYLYQPGAEGNIAFVIRSVGLPTFPYQSAKGNISLHRCKGVWISGINAVMVK